MASRDLAQSRTTWKRKEKNMHKDKVLKTWEPLKGALSWMKTEKQQTFGSKDTACDTALCYCENKNTSHTFKPVLWIFSVSWSTAVLEGAHTSTEPPVCFTSWYTMVAEVTVLPVPGGPWMRDRGRCRACFRAYCCKGYKSSLLVKVTRHLIIWKDTKDTVQLDKCPFESLAGHISSHVAAEGNVLH